VGNLEEEAVRELRLRARSAEGERRDGLLIFLDLAEQAAVPKTG